LAPFGLLVKDGIGFAQFFSQLTYSYTKREGNKVAHSLAMLAINYPDYSLDEGYFSTSTLCYLG